MGIFYLSEKIRFLPVIHGSANFTRIIKDRLLSSSTDCLAVGLPPEFQTTVEDLIMFPLIPVNHLLWACVLPPRREFTENT